MCLRIWYDTEEEAKAHKPSIAYWDILVFKRAYKRGNRCYEAPYTKFVYEIGYHYYQKGRAFRIVHDKGSVAIEIYDGLHAYTSEKAARGEWLGCETVYAIIPKGARYYVRHGTDEIVSSQLIFPTNKNLQERQPAAIPLIYKHSKLKLCV